MPKNVQPNIDDVLVRLSEVERDAERLASELAHAQRLATIGTIAAGVAHEINNILTPVLSYAAYAQANPDDHAMARKAIDKAVSGAGHAADITRALLDFSAVDRPDLESAAIADVVTHTLTCLARDPVKDGIEVNIDVDPGLSVRMQPQRLQQVLLNLMLNATEAMRRAHRAGQPAANRSDSGRCPGGQLTIAAHHAAGERIAIKVSDTGPGLPTEVRARLFEPFVTNHNFKVGGSVTAEDDEQGGGGSGGDDEARDHRFTDARHEAGQEAERAAGGNAGERPEGQVGGYGLGLSICKTLVEQAGGSIEATSDEGAGTTFTIILAAASEARRKSA